MRVYRLEKRENDDCKVGKGAYRYDEIFDAMDIDCWSVGAYLSDSKGDDDSHPEPGHDMKLYSAICDYLQQKPRKDDAGCYITNHFYALQTIQQLKNWFFREDLYHVAEEVGYKVSVYEVPDDNVLVGSFQVAFLPDNATLVEVISLLEI